MERPRTTRPDTHVSLETTRTHVPRSVSMSRPGRRSRLKLGTLVPLRGWAWAERSQTSQAAAVNMGQGGMPVRALALCETFPPPRVEWAGALG